MIPPPPAAEPVVALAAAGVDGLAEVRAGLAAWLLIGFGGICAVWGWKQAARGAVHAHLHAHEAPEHLHPHGVASADATVPASATGSVPGFVATPRSAVTPWVLFSVFLFGPCEPLLPLLLAPEIASRPAARLPMVLAFTAATLVAMLACTFVGLRSAVLLDRPRFAFVARFHHSLSGLLVLGCGVAMRYGN